VHALVRATVYEVTGKIVEFSGTPPTSAADRDKAADL
jgi:hypothetical protein